MANHEQRPIPSRQTLYDALDAEQFYQLSKKYDDRSVVVIDIE